jgi:putative hydrolase of the HAD superfamily
MAPSRTQITTLFLDIGGVLLTNGWDRHARAAAAERFHLEPEEVDDRHHLTFDTYEEGKLDLDTYLDRVIFYRPRDFTRAEFREFMFGRSRPFPEMIDLVGVVKSQYGLRSVAVSNEGRELTVHRIRKFGLTSVIDVFVSSCFVHLRKPDVDMYRLALDVSQSEPENVLYLDDRELFVEVAGGLGIRAVWHRGFQQTRKVLAEHGLAVAEHGLVAGDS